VLRCLNVLLTCCLCVVMMMVSCAASCLCVIVFVCCCYMLLRFAECFVSVEFECVFALCRDEFVCVCVFAVLACFYRGCAFSCYAIVCFNVRWCVSCCCVFEVVLRVLI